MKYVGICLVVASISILAGALIANIGMVPDKCGPLEGQSVFWFIAYLVGLAFLSFQSGRDVERDGP